MGLDVYKMKPVKLGEEELQKYFQDSKYSNPNSFVFSMLFAEDDTIENYERLLNKFNEFSFKQLIDSVIDYERYKKEYNSNECSHVYSGYYGYDKDKCESKIEKLKKSGLEMVEYPATGFTQSDCVYIFKLENRFIVTNNCHVCTKHFDAISCVEIDYQRKGQNENLYTKFIGSKNAQIKMFVFADELDELKTCFGKDEPIQNWNLEDDEFIYLSF